MTKLNPHVKSKLARRPPSAVPLRAGRKARATNHFEKALALLPRGKHVLRLFVAGATDRSRQAVLRARQLCETELKGDYELQVIDVYQQPILARDGQIVATPTLVREFPRPVRRFVGSLANTAGLFVGLEVATGGKSRV